MIKPTIGRVVLFNNGLSIQRVPALISFVHDDTTINIGGFTAEGKPFNAVKIHLVPSDCDAMCNKNQAEWMEYQKTQSVKHESNEVDLTQEDLEQLAQGQNGLSEDNHIKLPGEIDTSDNAPRTLGIEAAPYTDAPEI